MDSPSRTLRVINVGRRAYAPVLELQESLVAQRKEGVIGDTLKLYDDADEGGVEPRRADAVFYLRCADRISCQARVDARTRTTTPTVG